MSLPSRRLMPMARIAIAAALIGMTALLVLCMRPIGSYRAAVVLSGSMEPAIRTGSLMVTRRVSPAEYRQGDVIAFRPPFKGNVLVVHRISRLYLNESGVWMAETKGDANSSGDAWSISLGSVEGKMAAALPYAGYAISWVRTTFGFLALITLSFFLCVLGEMRSVAEMIGRREPAS